MRKLCLLDLLLVVVFAISHPVASQCPTGDRLYDAVCYEFVERNELVTYDDASIHCQTKNKNLVDIERQDQMDFVASVLNEIKWEQALVGMKYRKTGWRWASSDSLLRGQGCLETAYSDESGLLNTLSDGMTIDKCINFCSRNLNLFAAVQGSQFCYCSASYIWSQTKSNCSLPCSGASNEYCGHYFNSLTFFTAEGVFDNWLIGRPSVIGDCAAIKVDRLTNSWVDNDCSVTLPFICRINLETPSANANTASGYTCGGGICYYLYSDLTLSWRNADRFCQTKGGRLASIESLERQEMIDRLLFSSTLSGNTLVWVGAVNSQWFHGNRNPLAFEGWISVNEPVTPATHSCAATAVTFDGKFGFKTTRCKDIREVQNRFICSSPGVGVTPRATTPTTTTTPQPIVRFTETPRSVPVGRTTPRLTTTRVQTNRPLASTTTTAPFNEPTTPARVVDRLTTTERSEQTTTGIISRDTPPSTQTLISAVTSAKDTATSSTNVELSSTDTVPLTITTVTTAVQLCNATCRNMTTADGRSVSVECWPRLQSSISSNSQPTTVNTDAPTATPPAVAETSSFSQPEVFYSLWYDNVIRCEELSSSSSPPKPTTTTQPIAVDLIGDSGAVRNTKSKKAKKPALQWWAILLIVVAAVILLAVVVGVVVYAVNKKNEAGSNQVGDAPEAAGGDPEK